MLTLVSGVNIAAWVLMYRELHDVGRSGRVPGMEIMLLLSAAYVFGCAFRSLLPRADVQRICLFDTWLSSVAVGRTVATVAEICFAAQWTMILLQLGTMSGASTAVNAAWVIVPLMAAYSPGAMRSLAASTVWCRSMFIFADARRDRAIC